MTAELTAKIEAITPQSFNFEVNVNCFISDHMLCDTRPEVVEKDEAVAREMAQYLWAHVLPALTEHIRTQQTVVQDGEHLVQTLHSRGINLRYLGKLAQLAMAQELEDANYAKKHQQRKYAIPVYWLDLLEVEMIARGVKHIIDSKLRSDAHVRQAPTAVIAAVLNAVVGAKRANKTSEETVLTSLLKDEDEAKKKSAAKSHGHGKHGKANHNKQAAPSQAPLVLTQYHVESAKKIRTSLIEQVHRRFGHTLSLFDEAKGLTMRISPEMLLRRICQVVRLRVSCREYDFAGTVTPFTTEDIVDLLPRVKSSEPDTVFPDARQAMEMSRLRLLQDDLGGAYEAAQDASNWILQVAGQTHKDAAAANERLAEIIARSADYPAAIVSYNKCLATVVHAKGLDTMDAIQCHVQLSALHAELKNFRVAATHLLTAKYLVKLMSGPYHPEMVAIYVRFAALFAEVEDWSTAFLCWHEASIRTSDQAKYCDICCESAALLARTGRLHEAVEMQKRNYLLAKQIYGDDGERTVFIKSTLEQFMRLSLEAQKEAIAALAAAAQETTTTASTTTTTDKDGEAEAKKSGAKKKNSGGKNGKSKAKK